MIATPNALLRRLGYVRWGPPDFPMPTDLAGPGGLVNAPSRHEVLEAIARPEPETDPADRDSDRLATELFRRYGSVERGAWRGREQWVADAEAVRAILATDAGFARIVESIVSAPVRISPDPEASIAAWNDGFDEGREQMRREADDEWVAGAIVGSAIAVSFVVLIRAVRWLVGRRHSS